MSTTITFRVTETDKQRFMSRARELGLSTSAILKREIHRVNNGGAVVYDDSVQPSRALQTMVQESRADYRRGQYASAHTVEEAMDILDHAATTE